MSETGYANAYVVAYRLRRLIRGDRLGELPLYEHYDWLVFIERLSKKAG